MEKYLPILASLLVISGCTKKEELVVIEGKSFDIKSETIYLTTMERHAVIIDSARVKDGRFRFSFEESTDPFPACIAYRNPEGKTEVVRFVSETSKIGNIKRRTSDFFIVENGNIQLVGSKWFDRTGKKFATIIGGLENKMVSELGYENIASIDVSNEETYSSSIQDVIDMVNAYSSSKLLLKRLSHHAWQYKKDDISKIYPMFNPDMKRTELGSAIEEYIKALPDNYNPTEAIPLKTPKGEFVTDYTKRNKLNMVFFTKTYIHSTTLFLFYLKRRQEEFLMKDLYMVDVGLDEVEEWWKSKLANSNEKIWEQLYVSSAENRQLMFNRYQFGGGFPLIIFFDSDGDEVGRFAGYDDHTIDNCNKFIMEYFKLLSSRRAISSSPIPWKANR